MSSIPRRVLRRAMTPVVAAVMATSAVVLTSSAATAVSPVTQVWQQRTPSVTPVWQQLTPPVSPTGSGLMVFDAKLGVLVFVGNPGTWTFNGQIWSQVSTATTPPPRYGQLAYDARTGDVVLFGGVDPYNHVLNDTWLFNGTDWRELHPAVSPPPTVLGAMTYDAKHDQVVLVGGSNCTSYTDASCLNPGTWTFDGATWTKQQPTHDFAGLLWPSMAYNAKSQRVVLLGGQTCQDSSCTQSPASWFWTGSDWSAQSTPTTLCRYATMGYNDLTGELISDGYCDGTEHFGPHASTDDLTWLQQGAAASMPTFELPAQAYDPVTEQYIVFDALGHQTTWSYQVLVPGAPNSVVATSHRGSTTVTWKAPPANSTAPVERYVVTSSAGRGCTAVGGSEDEAPPTTCTITGLDPFVTTTIYVVAENTAGDSSPASAIARPAAPRPRQVIPYSHAVVVKWSPPVDTIGVIGRYTASATDVGGHLVGSCSTGTTGRSCMITGLADLASISVVVGASQGSPRSVATQVSAPLQATPATPLRSAASGLAAALHTNGRFSAWWSAADGGDGEVVTYEVHLNGPNASDMVACTSITTSCSARVAGLVAHGSYRVSIVAQTPAARAGLVRAPRSAPLTIENR